MNALEKQFEHHFQVIKSQKFEGGLGNDVPFFISTFLQKPTKTDKLIDLLLRSN